MAVPKLKRSGGKARPSWFTSAGNVPHLKAYALLAIVLLASLGWLGYRQLQINAERSRFMEAKSDLHAIAQQIVAAAGVPSSWQAKQTCGYTNAVYGQGARYCDVDEYLFYDTASFQEAGAFAHMIEEVVKKSSQVRSYAVDVNSGNEVIQSDSFVLSVFKQCGIEQVYMQADQDYGAKYPKLLHSMNMGISIDLNCGGSAKSEYFPIQQ